MVEAGDPDLRRLQMGEGAFGPTDAVLGLCCVDAPMGCGLGGSVCV